MPQPTPPATVVLGIDPGLNTTGYGVIRVSFSRTELIEAGVIRGGSAKLPLSQRLLTLHTGIADVITSFQPAVLALEELYSHYERPRTAILMGHARGAICLAAAQAEIPVASYAATNVKKMLTGSGRASKEQVQLAICREFSLAEKPDPPDVADALAIALCHAYTTRLGGLSG